MFISATAGVVIALNVGGQAERLAIEAGGKLLLSTHLDRAGERVRSSLSLRPHEGLIFTRDPA
jgi:hypothetical protein